MRGAADGSRRSSMTWSAIGVGVLLLAGLVFWLARRGREGPAEMEHRLRTQWGARGEVPAFVGTVPARAPQLPSTEVLRKTLQSLALLDFLLVWEGSEPGRADLEFHPAWSPGVDFARWDNQSGEHFVVLFVDGGVVLKGFAHEVMMTPYRTTPPTLWPGIYDGLPPVLDRALSAPEAERQHVTFCFWRSQGDDAWKVSETLLLPTGPDPDGSADVLQYLPLTPDAFLPVWTEMFVERGAIDPAPVRAIYASKPLSEATVRALNPQVPFAEAVKAARRIGYPSE
jgi:hypothetical protein